MPIIYALVARGPHVLAEYTAGGLTGNFSTVTRVLLNKIPPDDGKMSYVYDKCVDETRKCSLWCAACIRPTRSKRLHLARKCFGVLHVTVLREASECTWLALKPLCATVGKQCVDLMRR